MLLWASVLFAVYACLFLVLKQYANEAAGYMNTAVQVALDSTACVLCLVFFRRQGVRSNRLRTPLILLAGASALMAIVDFTWGVSVNIRGLNETSISLYFNRIPYTAALLLWLAFWTSLVQVGADRPAIPLLIAVLLSSGGLFLLFVAYVRYSLQSPTTHVFQAVFVYIFIGLELIGLLLCVGSSAALSRFPAGIAVAYISFSCADLFINASELSGVIPQNSFAELVWTFAEVSLLCGIVSFFPTFHATVDEQSEKSDARPYVGARLFASPVLVLLAFGSLVTVLLLKDRVQLAALLVLITGVTIVLNVLSRWLEDAINDAFPRLISFQPMEGIGAQSRRVLALIGLWETFRSYKRRISSGAVLPLGREFPFNASEAWRQPEARMVFICMPFSAAWSAEIRTVIQRCVERAGWTSIRADEVYDRPDVLDQIWTLTCQAGAIIADVTGHNANVLYELGIAHALGKPLILLCQRGTALPFDLSTRRALFYEIENGAVRDLDVELARRLSAIQQSAASPDSGAQSSVRTD